MSLKEFAINHIAEIYEFSSHKRRVEFVREKIGTLVTFSTTEEVCSRYNIVGIDKFSKKEKNIFADILYNHPYAAEIVDQFNYHAEHSGMELKDKKELLKNLNTVDQFLKAVPYNSPEFVKKVYSEVISWGFLGDNKNLDILKKGFNLYIDKNTLTDFLDANIHLKSNAANIIKQADMIHQDKESKSVVIPSTAAALSMMTMGSIEAEIATLAIPKITALCGSMAFGGTVLSLAPVAIGAYAFYKTFQLINGSLNKFVEKTQGNMINTEDPGNFSHNSRMNDCLSRRIFKDMMYDWKFDTSDEANKNYISLCILMNEKLINTEFKISKQLQDQLKLTDVQVTELDGLTRDRIHEIANVSSPQVRKLMLLNVLSADQENFIKEVSNAEILLETNNKNGKYFNNVAITNMAPELQTKISVLPVKDQAMINFYLNVFTSAEGKCQQVILKSLENSLDTGDHLLSTLKMKLNDEIINRAKPEDKNRELSYLKRVSSWIAGTSNEHVARENQVVKGLIVNRSHEMNCHYYNKVINVNPGVGEKLKTSAVNVLYRIGKMRDQLKDSAGMDVSNSVTLRI